MQTRSRSTRSSVLGKRAHQSDASSSTSHSVCEPPTPDQTPNPKRVRVSLTGLGGDGNKENVPPFRGDISEGDSSPTTSRTAPALRRMNTELISPSRPHMPSRRHASTSNLYSVPATPTTEIAHLSLATPPPTPPISLLPIHTRARAFLRATCNSTSEIAGRALERDIIRGFVTSFAQAEADDTPRTLYISGSPGTGKTALVNSVLRDLEEADESRLRVVSVNCMALNNADELWDRLLEELSDGKKGKGRGKKSKGHEAVSKALADLDSQCILVLDELDHIAASFSSLVSLFSIPNSSSFMRIIGIANTHTMTSSLPQFNTHGVNGVQTLHFAPYTPGQLLEILQTRLKSLFDGDDEEKTISTDAKKFLPLPTLTLLTKKIAAQTGDVRSLFEVLRGAIDLASIAASIPTTPDANPLNTPAPVVSPANILAALKAHTPSSAPTRSALPSSTTSPSALRPTGGNSEIVMKVRNLGLQAHLVLLAVLLASKRLEAGLPLSSTSSVTASPSKSVSRSPMKRTPSSNSTLTNSSGSSGAAGIDTTVLHAYYFSVLTRASNEVFTPVSRSEFGDVVGMLEVVGLASLSSSLSSVGASGGAKRTFGRSASFGGVGKSKGIGGQEVKIAAGVRSDEVLRGLGIEDGTEAKDVRQEEIRAIWQRERAKLSKDVKTLESRKGKCAGKTGDMFVDAMED